MESTGFVLFLATGLCGAAGAIFAFWWTVIDISLRKDFSKFSKCTWLTLVILLPIAGAVAYHIVGRKDEVPPQEEPFESAFD